MIKRVLEFVERSRKQGSLTWDQITVASKIMIPIYIALFCGLTINYLTTSLDRLRTASAGLNFADQLLGIRGWGVMFGIAILLMLIALWLHSRMMFRYALLIAAICMSIWAVVLFVAMFTVGASPTAWMWPGFVCGACIASNKSLLKGEM